MNIEEIKRIVSLQLGIRNINDEDHFLDDLKAESFDVMNIVVAVEEKYHIKIKESEIPQLLTPAVLYQFAKNQLE